MSSALKRQLPLRRLARAANRGQISRESAYPSLSTEIRTLTSQALTTSEPGEKSVLTGKVNALKNIIVMNEMSHQPPYDDLQALKERARKKLGMKPEGE